MVDSNLNSRINNRIEWIDVCKGILILLMVWGHIPNISDSHQIDITYMRRFYSFSFLYICWFMQAFFILTGFTTNFNIDSGSFIKKQIKTIIIPWFCFSVISRLFYILYLDEGLFYTIDGINYFFLIEDYWFLSALFFSKLCVFLLLKTVKSYALVGSVLLGLMVIGFFLIIIYVDKSNPYHYLNFFHFKDFLCMVFFIWIGIMLKRYYRFHKIIFQISASFFSFLFLFKYILYSVSNYSFPEPVVISHYSNIYSIFQLPIYILYVLTGSFTMFYFAMKLKTLSLLSYFGKNSLVVYCSHFVFLCLFIDGLYNILPPSSYFYSLIFLIGVFFLSLLSCSFLIRLLSYKPFNYILGKF